MQWRGERCADGAGPERRTVHWMMLRDAAGLTAIGMAAGVVCAIEAAELIRDLLFGVEAWDEPALMGTVGRTWDLCAVGVIFSLVGWHR